MIDSGREPRDVSETMVLNNYVAMQEAKVESGSQLTPELIRNLHQTLTLHNDYWFAEYATISEILRKEPGKYGDAYEHSEDDDGDLTYFVLHQLRVFTRALDRLDQYIEIRRAETSRRQRALTSAVEPFNFRQGEILESLASQEYTTVSVTTVANRLHVTEQTGRNDLRQLEGFGLPYRLPQSRPAVWIASGNLPVVGDLP